MPDHDARASLWGIQVSGRQHCGSRPVPELRLPREQTLAALRALAGAIDTKDSATRRHSERVATLAVQLARRRGWSAPAAERLREAALVHDVGKVAIPDVILLKPAPLDADEYERVKQHAALGAELAGNVLDAEQVAWVRHHHERWDGAGYPDGLRGPDIPDGAQLLTLADAWDALVSDRPYAPARNVPAALEECRRCAGSHFAPSAVAALEALLA
jgi:putative nucleotidyltransferase with HDIG domain